MANNENVNKVIYGNQTLIDLTSDSVTSETLLEGETAHDRSGAQITGSAVVNTVIEENDSFALVPTSEGNALARKIYGMSVQDGTPTPSSPVDIESASADFKCVGKNLNKYPYYETTKTVNGITFIDNGDGSVTVRGIASADAVFRPHMRQKGENNDFKLENGNYIFTGCPSGGSSSSYLIIVYRTDENNTYKEYGRDYGEGLSFTVNGDYFSTESANIGIDISIKSGQDFTTPKTFYPMIRLASVADATYEPYKHTDIYTDNYGSNLVVTPFYNTTKTRGGITYTDNNDGTVTVSGTATADSFFGFRSRTEYGTASAVMLQNKEYRVTGCPKGGSPATYNITVARGDTSSSKGDFGMDVGDGFNFVDKDASSYALTLNIIVKSGTVFSSPVVFKPEVREVTRETLRSIEVTSNAPYNLVKDGHYYIADTIDWDEVDGYTLTKRIDETTFDETANWQIDSQGTSSQRFSVITVPKKSGYPMTNRFVYKDGNNEFGYFRLGGSKREYLVIQDGQQSFASLADFKTWVQSNNITLVSALETPTKTSLTSAQAKALLSMRTYDESTSIDAVNSPAPVVELEYAKNRTSGRALTGHNEGKTVKGYEHISYAEYLQLTPQQIASGKYIVEGSSEATGIFGKVLTGSLAIGSTTVVLQDSFITTTSMIDVYTDVYGVSPTNVTVATGSITLTFEAQQSILNVKVRVM